MTLADPKQQALVASAYDAAKKLDWKTVMHLIDTQGFDPDTRVGQERQTMVHFAAKLGQVGALQQLHTRGAALEGIFDKNGQDALHLAVKSGRYREVEWLAKQGVDLDAMGKKNPHPKPYRHGAPVDFDEPRLPPLHLAAKKHDLKMVELLLDFGANPDSRDHEEKTALMQVVNQPLMRATRQTAALLVAHGVDVNAVDANGNTAMMEATRTTQNLAHAEMLADMGALLDHPQAALPLSDWMKKSPVNVELADRFVRGRKHIAHPDPATLTDKSELFAPNAQGYAPLDSPENWQKLPEFAAALHAAGNPLTKADFGQQNAFGKSWMVRAVECGGYTPLRDVLVAAGEPLSGKDFVEKDRPTQPSPLGMMAEDMWLGVTVFRDISHWRGQPADALHAFCKDLPQGLREQFGNYHQILATLRQDAQSTQRGR